MSKTCRFSIVIPTRNRPATLKHTLQTCLNQLHFGDYDIVVNDNSDDDDTKVLIDDMTATDARAQQKLRYFKRSEICCMAANFEDAVGHAKGRYVIVIGDDDGILPMALKEIDTIIGDRDIGIVKWSNGLYTWPAVASQETANYLGFSLARCSRMTNGREALIACMVPQNYDTLPMLYINSAIRSDLIAAMRDEEGKLFRSQSPDVYSAIVLSYRCGTFLNVSVPFTIAGLSQHSNGIASAFNGSNAVPRRDFRALNATAGISQHPAVPDLSIFPTVAYSDSFYIAKQFHFPQDDEVDLPRRQLMEACVARADTSQEAVREELLRVCGDDPDLAAFTRNLMANKTETLPPVRLKPADLGFDGENLHLDTRDYGVATIADAVALVHRIVWPADAPLRYDQPGATETRANLEATLKDLVETRSDLVARSTDLEAALKEIVQTRSDLILRSADLESTLDDLRAVREILVDRTNRLETSLAECNHLRSELASARR